MVNFAQGGLMMLGTCVALTLVGTMGMGYWLVLLLAALIMAIFGYLVDALVLRRIIGQPQFAIVILTISLGFLFRAGRGFVWGHETQTFETPFTNRIINAAGAILALESLSMIAGTVVLAGLLYHFFDFTPSSPAPRSATVPQTPGFDGNVLGQGGGWPLEGDRQEPALLKQTRLHHRWMGGGGRPFVNGPA